MRNPFLVILLFHFTFSAFSQKPGAKINVTHYTYRLLVSDENDQLSNSATVTLKMLEDASEVILNLASANQQGRGMKISSIKADGIAVPFRHEADKVFVAVAGHKGQEKSLEVGYAGIPADGLIISKTKYGKRSFFADNWPDRARQWLICVDDPADKAAVDFIITAPTHYQVVANGILIEETNLNAQQKLTHWKEAIDLPTKVMTVGIAEFAVNRIDSTGNTEISSWVYPEDREKGFYDFGLAKEIIPFFEKIIAPFPYRKLANVQSKTRFGGLENAGAIFYSELLVTGTRTAEPTIAHEIAHQWFGDMATETDFSHLWLSEGFATYMTMYFMEMKYGVDSANALLQKDRLAVVSFATEKPGPVVDSVSGFMDLLNANSYQKGSWVLHMLRYRLGDQTFWKGIQQYYKMYAGKNARTADFQKIMEQVSGQNLRQFFYQWLYVAGQPELEVSWKYNAGKKRVTITVVQQQKMPFEFPVDVTIYGTNKAESTITKKIQVSEKTTSMEVPLNFTPVSVLIDENTKLLFEDASTANKGSR
jgi:aminopeptidase N